MTASRYQFIASASLIALIFLCLGWELWWAPLKPGGSWLVLKSVFLLAPLFGILRGKRYTYQWVSMLCLLYLTEGVLRVSDPGLTAVLAGIEIALSVLLFFSTMMYARNTAPSRQASAQPGR